MIYLVGGPPRCGKSTIARGRAATIGASQLPADYLTTIISGYIPDEDAATRLPRLPDSFRDNDTKYARYTVDEIIDNNRTKAATTWQAVRDVIEYAAADGIDFVIDGLPD